MAFVRSPKFYLINGAKELITVLIETWTEDGDYIATEKLCKDGELFH